MPDVENASTAGQTVLHRPRWQEHCRNLSPAGSPRGAGRPRPHQLAMLDAARPGESVLLIAPTGGGKTLAGFLPSLVDLAEHPRPGLHTLYVSPLKALATDIARNLTAPGRRRWACPSPSRPAPATPPPTAAPASRSAPPQPAADHAGKPRRAALARPTPPRLFARPAPASSWTRSTRWPAPSAATSWRSASPGSRTLAPAARRVGLSATVAHPDAIARLYSAPTRRDRGRRTARRPRSP